MPSLEEMRRRLREGSSTDTALESEAEQPRLITHSTRRVPTLAELLPDEDPVTDETSPARIDISRLRAARRTSVLPERAASPKPSSTRGKGLYTPNDLGTDAELHFGKYANHMISEITATPRGRAYLMWMLEKDFPEPLLCIIRDVIRR